MAHVAHDLDEEKPVCICIKGDTLTVSPDPVEVWIQHKDRVHWFLCGEGTIDEISFASGNGPFQAKHNIPKSRKHVLSNTVVNPSHATKTFKYTVKVTPSAGTQISLDPGVEVMAYPFKKPVIKSVRGPSSKGTRRR